VTRDEFEAECDAWYAAGLKEAEWKQIERTLSDLYARLATEGESVLLRQRIRRNEALLSALQGFPATMVLK